MRSSRARVIGSSELVLFCLPSLALALLAGACGEEKTVSPPPPPVTETGQELPNQLDLPPSIYDEQGRLMVSEDSVAGLPLPVGTKLIAEAERRHSYETIAPVDRLKEYFSKQLDTGSVRERGPGVVFEKATPRAARGAAVSLTVSLFPAGRDRTRIEVREIPPPSMVEKTVTQEEAARLLQEQYRLLD